MPEFMWRLDAEVEATRKLPGWNQFHRVCGQSRLYFDHITRQGKRGDYLATAFTLDGRIARHLVDGRGNTPLDAVVAAYEASGIVVREAGQWIQAMRGNDDFEDLVGDAPPEYEDLIG